MVTMGCLYIEMAEEMELGNGYPDLHAACSRRDGLRRRCCCVDV
jgi:hypothetical protein